MMRLLRGEERERFSERSQDVLVTNARAGARAPPDAHGSANTHAGILNVEPFFLS
jgi:hypothetical protein